jgi:hypothetical protein
MEEEDGAVVVEEGEDQRGKDAVETGARAKATNQTPLRNLRLGSLLQSETRAKKLNLTTTNLNKSRSPLAASRHADSI